MKITFVGKSVRADLWGTVCCKSSGEQTEAESCPKPWM